MTFYNYSLGTLRQNFEILVHIINPKKYPAAAPVGVTPKNGYCGAVDSRGRVKFSGRLGHVIQQVVSTFEVGATGGAPPARAHVRHRVNMGNEDFEVSYILVPISQRRQGGVS